MRTRSRSFPSLLAAATLVVLMAACGESGAGGAPRADDEAGVASAQGPRAATSAIAGEVQAFDVAEIDGCRPDEDGVIRCAHVDQEVTYEQTPPVAGMHAPVFQDCRFYDEPIFNEGAVHSLEHGAVWIAFADDLAEDQVEQIRSLAENPKVLAAPWDLDRLPAPIVFSAWGVQLAVEELPDEAAFEFLAEYLAGPRAPKPDAPCAGGYSGTRSAP